MLAASATTAFACESGWILRMSGAPSVRWPSESITKGTTFIGPVGAPAGIGIVSSTDTESLSGLEYAIESTSGTAPVARKPTDRTFTADRALSETIIDLPTTATVLLGGLVK